MDLLKEKEVKTRKDHLCHGCLKIIPKNSIARSETIADGGRVYTLYMCDSCKDWCKERKCRECYELDNQGEGYIKEHHEEGWCPEKDERHES